MLENDFPPFGLRISHEDMTLRVFRDADMAEYLDLLSGPIFADETVPWVFPWYQAPVEQRRLNALKAQWGWRSTMTPEDWNLAFGVYINDVLVGSQSVSAKNFARLGVVESGSWLALKYQGKHFGSRMRKLMLHFAFDHLGAIRAQSKAAAKNKDSLNVSLSAGYQLDGRRIELYGEQALEVQHISVTPKQFNRLEGEVVVTGLTDQLRAILGATFSPTSGLGKGQELSSKKN
ncbi:MAG: GNAT family N-acetyltransferase [Propionibacterium sp.]|nr:MAG: GNAT family N-acetyltransferase [Propionibacterium sp.]